MDAANIQEVDAVLAVVPIHLPIRISVMPRRLAFLVEQLSYLIEEMSKEPNKNAEMQRENLW